MTVLWTVKAVEEWCKSHGDRFFDYYEEAHRRFGRWIHSASYASCFELRERVEKYLEAKSVDSRIASAALWLFCGALDVEVEYNEQVYGLLKEALNHVAETSTEAIIRSHAKALVELIATAEKLKSGILCSG